MSRQLAISIAFSVMTMAAFALFASPSTGPGIGSEAAMQTGAAAHATAPAADRVFPALSSLIG
ncbi:hypothetical protein [Aurantiacibacter odishensis]|uniref:hypothetical protein n=1 Tax=Aurantiacibacter odishensis TaxID=1155476 RepID=UPI000E74DF5D|nr:hypothetical protein [Aurantiacibacter odishensis]